MKFNNVIKLLTLVLKCVFVLAILILSLSPFIWVLISSFKGNAEILSSTGFLPERLKYQNYLSAFKLAPLGQFYLNSVIVALFGTMLNLIILSMSAYVIARFNFKFKNFIISVLSLSMLIPGAALLQPLYVTVNNIGLCDRLLGLIIVYAGFGLPSSLYILSSYFLIIPKELEESAGLDGAGFIRTFVQIILPVARPGLGTAAVLQFILCWNEFQFALTLTTGNRSRTLPLAIYYFKSQFASDYGVMFAATIIVIIPSILVSIILQEQVVSGLTVGAVKA